MLNDFKWYRKLRGGIWYQIQSRRIMENNDYKYWTKTPTKEENIIKKEKYENNNFL